MEPSSNEARLDGLVSVSNPARRRRLWQLMSAAGAAAAFGVAAFGLSSSLLGLGWLAIAIAMLGRSVGDPDLGRTTGAFGHVELAHGLLMVEAGGRRLQLPVEAVADGHLVPSADALGLVLCTDDGTQIVLLETSGPPGAMLDALGLDQRTVRMPLVADPRALRGCVGLTVAPIVAAAGVALAMALGTAVYAIEGGARSLYLAAGLAVTAAALLLPAVGLAHFLVPHRVTIGREGLVLHRVLRRDRFVPYDTLRGVATSTAFLELQTTRGRIRVRASEAAAIMAVRAIEERRRAFVAHAPSHAVAAIVRGDRTWPRWRDDLGHLLSTARAGFRRGAVDRETLVRMVEDPLATPEQRVGAAYALAAAEGEGEGDDHHDPRLRVAVEGCAEPRLRVALHRALAGDLVEEVLVEAEAEAERARR